MVPNITLFLIFIAMTSVTAQTFQYSRGWTNGKRDGRTDVREFSNNLEKILTPCQLNKLKALLEGKTLSERFFTPCDYVEDEDNQPKRYKSDPHHNSGDLFDAFQ